jgi:hypothetical protein
MARTLPAALGRAAPCELCDLSKPNEAGSSVFAPVTPGMHDCIEVTPSENGPQGQAKEL